MRQVVESFTRLANMRLLEAADACCISSTVLSSDGLSSGTGSAIVALCRAEENLPNNSHDMTTAISSQKQGTLSPLPFPGCPL